MLLFFKNNSQAEVTYLQIRFNKTFLLNKKNTYRNHLMAQDTQSQTDTSECAYTHTQTHTNTHRKTTLASFQRNCTYFTKSESPFLGELRKLTSPSHQPPRAFRKALLALHIQQVSQRIFLESRSDIHLLSFTY